MTYVPRSSTTSSTAMPDSSRLRVFVLVNARSGGCRSTSDVRRALHEHLGPIGQAFTVHELEEREEIRAVVCQAARDGYDVIIAAGGDGTVSAVANGMIHVEARLGIIPLGTANVLARELGIPLEIAGASALIAGPHELASVDAMKVGGTHYFTQIGVGIDAAMIRDTSHEEKKRLGVLAYIRRLIGHLLGASSRRLSIRVDGRRLRQTAIQLLVANCGTLGASGLRWGPDIRPDDGRIDVCILRARTILDSLRLFVSVLTGSQPEDPDITYRTASQAVAVHASPPLPVQGDGELLGQTPITVQVVPRALRVIVPSRCPGPSGA